MIVWRTPILFSIAVLLSVPVPASELGRPLLRSYGAQDYGAHPQNWAIVQDDRGVMYFGNTSGVLEYDGSSWRRIPLANGSIARSLTRAPDGTIFVGGVGEVGYLAVDDHGSLTYVSLVELLPEEHRDFSDVWRACATTEGIFFIVQQGKLLRFTDGAFQVWELGARPFIHRVDDRIFFVDPDHGLTTIDGDALRVLPGGEILAGREAFAILPFSESSLLIGTRDEGLLRFDVGTASLTSFPTEVDLELREHRIYHGVDLPNDAFALATYTGGAYVLDRTGRLLHHLDKRSGLADDSVWFLSPDQEGGLWLALHRGLCRVEVACPITAYDEFSGLEGTVETIARHLGELHVGTSTGLHRLREGRFSPVPGVGTLCWNLLSFEDEVAPMEFRLLAGTYEGVFEVHRGGGRMVAPCLNAYQILRSGRDPERFFVAHHDGVLVLRSVGREWHVEGSIRGVDQEAASLTEDRSGALWVGTAVAGVLRVEPASDVGLERAVTRRYGVADGVPELASIRVLKLDDEVCLSTSRGLYRFDESADRFLLDDRLEDELHDRPLSFLRLVPDGDRSLWLALQEPMRVARVMRAENGSSWFETSPFLRLPPAGVYAFLPEDAGITWLGGVEGLFRYDGREKERFGQPGQTLIRRVQLRDGTPLFDGKNDRPGSGIHLTAPIPFAENSIRFEFSTPSFFHEKANQYSYQLEGFDPEYSDWSPVSSKEYTGLRERRYRFLVRSRTPSGIVGSKAVVSFRILPPWHRTMWAYGCFAILVLGVVYVVDRRRSARHLREKSELEATVRQRTSDLMVHTKRLEETTAELKASRVELESFAYSVSHDLQGPLRRLSGLSQLVVAECGEGLDRDGRKLLNRIDANAKELSELVTALLTLSRLTRARLKRADLDLSSVSREVVDELRESEPDREVRIRIEEGLRASGDEVLVRVILANLIANAWKYTRDTPEPRIEVGVEEARSLENDPTVFVVRDNGCGFDPRYADKLFLPFQRLHRDDEFEGSGIGLATVYRLVQRHGGSVWAEAAVGEGASFYFSLEAKMDAPDRCT